MKNLQTGRFKGDVREKKQMVSSLKRSWKSSEEFLQKLKNQLTKKQDLNVSQARGKKERFKSEVKRTARSAECSKESKKGSFSNFKPQRVQTEVYCKPFSKNNKINKNNAYQVKKNYYFLKNF